MGAQVLFRGKDCVGGMGHRRESNDAVVKDVLMEPSREECAGGMGQRRKSNDAAATGVQVVL